MVQDFKPSLDVVSQSPLRRFKGHLEKYEAEAMKAQDGRDYTQIKFSFTGVEPLVVAPGELYPWPTAEIRISYNQNAATKWGAFAKSIRSVLGPESQIDTIIGKNQEWAMIPYAMRQLNQQSQEWENANVDCWQLVSMDGATPLEDLNPHIVALIDGKNDTQANQVLLQDPKMIARPQLISDLTERKLIPALEMAGMVTRDSEGVYHKA